MSRANVQIDRLAPCLRMAFWLAFFVGAQSLFVVRSEAHEGATGVVKERMDAMSNMACAMKTVGDMVKGRRALDLEEVAALAQAVTSHAADMPLLFPDTPDSRNTHRTEARPTIWERWPEFVSRAERLEKEGEQLKELARSGLDSAVDEQFKILGKTCGACHKDFRRKKQRRQAESPSDQDCAPR